MLEITKVLADIAGLDISDALSQCAPYASDASGGRAHVPLAVVRPHTMPALIALVRRAAELGLRLQPISSTGQHQRGDTLCQPDSLVVDMSGFDQVVRVDRRNRVALFEAGVTFPKLCAALARQQMRAMLPLCPRPGKSALTAYLEREPTIYPRFHWDMSDPLLCIEVVFGSGELFRSGGAAGPGTLSEQWASGDAQKTPMGPGHSDIARIIQGAQGNLGIVSWCSAKAEPIPMKETLYRLDSPDLGKLIDLCYRLLHRSLPDICFIVDSAALAALQGELPARAPSIAPSQWHLVFSLSAPQVLGMEKLAWMQDEVQRYCSEAGLAGQLLGFTARHQKLHQSLLAAGAERSWWKQAGQQASFELFFQSTMERCPRFLTTHARALSAHAWNTPTMCYIQPLVGGRNCHMEFIFPHAGTIESSAAVTKLATSTARALQVQGAFFSRPYGPLTELIDSGAAGMLDRLGQIFDPSVVMSASTWPIIRHHQAQARAA